jgi:4-hydroxy-2-oxoglutarate aldolase
MPINGNGTHRAVSRPLAPGIYAPIPSFFLPESEDLGKRTYSPRFQRKAKLYIMNE